MHKKKRLVSIVTVTYNAESTIKQTLDSILNQNYKNIQVIVKDAESNDNTNSIISDYRRFFFNRGYDLKHIVGKDTGIYNAMNIASKYCDGDYILYLNAGDMLQDEDTISDVLSMNIDNYDILYGDTVFVSGVHRFLWKGNLDVIKDKCPFCHQSMLIRKEWQLDNNYDESLEISADYDFIYKSYVLGAKFFYVNRIISVYIGGGKSGQELVLDRKEHRNVQIRYNAKEEISLRRRVNYSKMLLSAYIQEFIFRNCESDFLSKLRLLNKRRIMKEL